MNEEIEIRPTDDTLTEGFRSVRLRTRETTILIDYQRNGEVRLYERKANLISDLKNVTPVDDAPHP